MNQQNEVQARIVRQLGCALKDSNSNIRFLALEGLQFFPGSKECELIAPLLQDSDRFVKWKAIQVAGGLKLDSARPSLVLNLENPDLNTRAFSALAIGVIGNPNDLKHLSVSFEREISPRVRQAIVRTLPHFSQTPPWDLLARASRDGDVGVRIDAAKVIGCFAPNSAACDILVNLLEKENNGNVFATAILGLGEFKQPILIGYLQHSLLHSESRIRANAIEALGKFEFHQVREIVFPFLKDPSNRVQANVISIFFQAGHGNEVPKHLRKLLDSGNRWERASGSWIAGKFRLFETVERLIELLHDDEAVVTDRAAWALGEIKSPKTFGALVNSYFKASPWALSNIIKAISCTATISDIPVLLSLFKQEQDPALKAKFINIFSSLKAAQVKGEINSLKNDPDHRIRFSSFRYLGTVNPLENMDALFSGLSDSNQRVRAICASLMLEGGDFRALKALSNLLTDQEKMEKVQLINTLRDFAEISRFSSFLFSAKKGTL
ncbi:HEAT repeat domain-containing protein [bacterium]|nr:HEAT repeat domain-containing protein [bacterium]